MRFAVAATVIASVVGVPLAVSATGPQMSSAEFLSAVRCVAYENAAAPAAALGAARWRLNAEAGKQPVAVVALAREQAQAIGAAVSMGEPAAAQACGASRSADAMGDRRGRITSGRG
ncbi:MAG: hypothetical protein HY054_06015 [Proteobacteria bacterium]|nr:hypothetical protein [Pseudomonadota bacterium]